MNLAIFNVSFSKSEKVLKEANLFKSKGIKPVGSVSDEFKSASLKSSYFKTFKIGLQNLDYDILLYDDSFFQFSFEKSEHNNYPFLRYAFFQNPQEYISYEEYLESELNIDYTTAGDLFIEEYQQYLTELEINTNSTTIRYDLDCKSYKPLIHSASHLHIGNSENVRIPCNKILSPLAFTIFVIKHIYYNNWQILIKDFEKFDNDFFKNLKQNCAFIMPPFWLHNTEGKDFFIG